ncbi:unnamed protein product, partial [Bubo scandiacus]
MSRREARLRRGFASPPQPKGRALPLCSSCPAVKQLAAFSEAQVNSLQHGQEGSAVEERFASPPEMG